MRVFFWVITVLSGVVMMLSLLIQEFSWSRQKELRYVSTHVEQHLMLSRLKLADISLNMAQDQVLISSVAENKDNTYSAKIKDMLALQEVSLVGIYNEFCGHFFQKSEGLGDVLACRPSKVESLYWLSVKEGKLLLVTRKLGPSHLLSVGFYVVQDWIHSLFQRPQSFHFGVSMKVYKESLRHMGVLLSYAGAHAPLLYDDHWLSRHVPQYVAPYSERRMGLLWIVGLMFVSLFLLIRDLWRQRGQLINRAQERDTLIRKEAQSLHCEHPGDVSLEGLLQEWKRRHHKLKRINSHRMAKIQGLENDLNSLQHHMQYLGYYKALTQEVVRNAEILHQAVQMQHENVDDLKSVMDVMMDRPLSRISHILEGWQEDITRRGHRKFLRSSLERAATTSTHTSSLEADIAVLLQEMQSLRSLGATLCRGYGHVQSYGRYFGDLTEKWSHIFAPSSPGVSTLYETLAFVVWQLRIEGHKELRIQTPQWQEPENFPRILADVLRCLLYEVWKLFALKAPNYPCFVIHYISYPDDRILILPTTDLHASPVAPSRGFTAESRQALSVMAHQMGRMFGMQLEWQLAEGEIETLSISWALTSVQDHDSVEEVEEVEEKADSGDSKASTDSEAGDRSAAWALTPAHGQQERPSVPQ